MADCMLECEGFDTKNELLNDRMKQGFNKAAIL